MFEAVASIAMMASDRLGSIATTVFPACSRPQPSLLQLRDLGPQFVPAHAAFESILSAIYDGIAGTGSPQQVLGSYASGKKRRSSMVSAPATARSPFAPMTSAAFQTALQKALGSVTDQRCSPS